MPTSIQCHNTSSQSQSFAKLAAKILFALTLTLSIAAGLAYAEIALVDGQQFNAMALLMQ